MLTKTVSIDCPIGLHARPAATLVALAGSFKSRVTMRCKDKTVALNSIIAVMTLGAGPGDQVEITVTGEDQAEAMARIANFFEKELPDM
jgi:phosphotransferase system HPr (HPr) family protein